MGTLRLLTLHLSSEIVYLPWPEEKPPASATEFQDRIHVFTDESISSWIAADGEQGSRLPPLPLFSGFASLPARNTDSLYRLSASTYVFSQWRYKSFTDPWMGFEAFVSQVRMGAMKTEGPWILRVVLEDGDAGYQGLRKIVQPAVSLPRAESGTPAAS